MKAVELQKMLRHLWLNNPNHFDEYKLVTKDGRAITGVHMDHKKKTVIMVQRDTFVETRVDT